MQTNTNEKNPTSEPTCNVCKKRLEEWNKFSLWGNVDFPEGLDQQKAIGACFGYMIRRLSHRTIPRMDLVRDTLTGKLPIPECGFIGCTLDFGHVH